MKRQFKKIRYKSRDIFENQQLVKDQTGAPGLYEALFQQAFDAIILVDPESKKIVEANQRLCHMTGYSYSEIIGMSLYDFFRTENSLIDACQSELINNRIVHPAIRKLHCKDGTYIFAERVATPIISCNKSFQLIIMHDISEERKLHRQINAEVHMAGKLQRQMLPADYSNELVDIKCLYRPLRVVSGDFFGYRFSKNKNVLNGYMFDVAGHGIATAFETAAVNALLREKLVKELLPTKYNLKKLNMELIKYFHEGSFVALIWYNFNFTTGILTCGFCGINSVLVSSLKKSGWIKHKASLMGAFDDARFSIVQIAIQPGDSFYFLTDGFSERFPNSKFTILKDYPVAVKFLSDLAEINATDDCSAVCVRVNGISDKFKFYFRDIKDISALHEKIRRVLALWGKEQTKHLELVINEAINNVLLHGSGQGCLRLKRVKNSRIVVRVKDSQKGSSAGSVLHKYNNKSTEELLEMMVTYESGRGILLMKLFTDYMCYNRDGSEVLLIRKLKI